MADYFKATNFSVKDTLSTGDPNKIVSGAEIDTEFNNIASSSATKADKVSGATSGNLAGLDANGNLTDSGETKDTIVSSAVPAGCVFPYAASSAPTGYLECNGTAVSRSTYADLFSAIGTTFGVGNGSTTFNLPDLRGEFIRGWDNGRGVDAARSFGSFQSDELKAHVHLQRAWGNGTDTGSFPASTNEGIVRDTRDTNSTGGSETRPRNIALMYIIKT